MKNGKRKAYLNWMKKEGLLIGGGAIVGGVILPPIYRGVIPVAPWFPTAPGCLQDNAVVASFVGAGVFAVIATMIWKKNHNISLACGGICVGQLIYGLGKCVAPTYFPYQGRAPSARARVASARTAVARTASMAPITSTGIPPAKVLA